MNTKYPRPCRHLDKNVILDLPLNFTLARKGMGLSWPHGQEVVASARMGLMKQPTPLRLHKPTLMAIHNDAHLGGYSAFAFLIDVLSIRMDDPLMAVAATYDLDEDEAECLLETYRHKLELWEAWVPYMDAEELRAYNL
jgi:hypothetical protein